MKKIAFIFFSLVLCLNSTKAQTVDTLVSVGKGQQLQFTIIKGNGVPVLFESGLGNGKDVWNSITKQIADITGAPVITYNRLSFGEKPQNYQIGFLNEIEALEKGLQKLGYAHKNIMLVSHSLGGMYHSFYASRHPLEVKAAVLIDDANICSLKAYITSKKAPQIDVVEKYIADILDTVIKNPMPLHIPVLDIVATSHVDDNGRLDTMWLNCHQNFVSQSKMRKLLLADGVGHSIFTDNPPLVVNAIVTQYAHFIAPSQKNAIIEKGYATELVMINEIKKAEVKCGHTEEDLNTWGYSLLENKEFDKAIEVFKLNVMLNPNGWNAYDSLAEAYLKSGKKDLAIKNYQKSLALNPNNDSALKALSQLLK